MEDKIDINDYLYLLPIAAHYSKKNMPRDLDLDDLSQIAYFGLIEAARRWDPKKSKGATFRTYALTTMRLRLIDQSRKMSFASRRAVQKSVEEHGDTRGVTKQISNSHLPTEYGTGNSFGFSYDYNNYEMKDMSRYILSDINNDRHRCILNDVLVLGQSQADVANIYNMSPSAISYIIVRSRDKLRKRAIEMGLALDAGSQGFHWIKLNGRRVISIKW